MERAEFFRQQFTKENEILEVEKNKLTTRNDVLEKEINKLIKNNNELSSVITNLQNENKNKKNLNVFNQVQDSGKIDRKQFFPNDLLSLSTFLEKINNFPKYDDKATQNPKFYYKGVLINSFYELEFNLFPDKKDDNFNEILRYRCVSIGIPNIRKNYTAINFNGRRVEIEQNAEFQHEIQIRIICDEDTAIYYKFKEYIDCTKNEKPYRLFNNSHIWIVLDGFKVIKLNHITIADLGQLEFDNGPSSNICFFNVSLKVVDYEFNSNISQQTEYDILLANCVKNNINKINNSLSTLSRNKDEINKLSSEFSLNDISIKRYMNDISINNEILKTL